MNKKYKFFWKTENSKKYVIILSNGRNFDVDLKSVKSIILGLWDLFLAYEI